MKSKKHLKRGFSLVELLVVITIIAILSVTAFVAVGGQTSKARNSRRMSDVSTIQSAVEVYFAEKGKYPSVSGSTFDENELDNTYLGKSPRDPWSDSLSYAYGVNAAKSQYQIAATLEEPDGTFKAYVVGNGTTLITGTTTNPSTCGGGGGAKVTDGDTCLPYVNPN